MLDCGRDIYSLLAGGELSTARGNVPSSYPGHHAGRARALSGGWWRREGGDGAQDMNSGFITCGLQSPLGFLKQGCQGYPFPKVNS